MNDRYQGVIDLSSSAATNSVHKWAAPKWGNTGPSALNMARVLGRWRCVPDGIHLTKCVALKN